MTQEQCDILKCPILLYTSIITRDEGDTRFCTTLEKFELDMQTLLDHGYFPISLQEAYLCRKGEKAWPDKPICVIFECGYKNNYTIAFPILQKLHIPVSIFIATDIVGVTEYADVENFCPHFGWDEAKKMADSGLVNIYPLWHPFDKEKPLIDETLSKIKLINDNLHNGNAAFAFSFKDCTDDQLEKLSNTGIKVCITDCFHISSERLNNGALPSICVNYTSDVIDIINHYKELCSDAFEKEMAKTNIAVYKEPSSEILSESVFLQIDPNPMVRNFLRHAFPLSVLQVDNKDKAERLVLNDYIEIIYKPWYDWFDYHNYLYDCWECLDYRKISGDILSANNINVIEYIINGLKTGYYSDIWLDTYYIPGKPGYNERHMSHGLLIYGYDSKSKEFHSLSYSDRGQYERLIVPIKAVYMGCSNKYFMYLNLIKKNNSATIDYDLRRLYDKLYDYINSVCHDDNMRYSKISAQQYYNYDATQKFIEHIKETAEKRNYVHMTSLYGFAEHKQIMFWRLKYIVDRENLPFDDIGRIYESTVKLTEYVVNMGLKYNMTGSVVTRDHLIDELSKLCIDEMDLINYTLSLIEGKLQLEK